MTEDADKLLAEVEPVAWRYRLPDDSYWKFVDGQWPELWGDKTYIRDPLFASHSVIVEREARERAEARLKAAQAVIDELKFANFSNDLTIKDRADQSARLFKEGKTDGNQ